MPFTRLSSTSNSSHQASYNSDEVMSVPQILFLSLLFGWIINTCIIGILVSVMRVASAASMPYKKLAAMMILFNVLCISCLGIAIWAVFFGALDCVYGSIGENVVGHCFYISFDIFILYKTLATCGFDRRVRAGIIVLLANRTLWAVVDIARSRASYDAATLTCYYSQDPLSGFAYNLSGLLSDLYATAMCIAFNWSNFAYTVSAVLRIVVKENILRSFLVVCITGFASFSTTFSTNAFLQNLSYSLQGLAYSAAVNSEHFLSTIRKDAMNRSMPSLNQVKNVSTNHRAAVEPPVSISTRLIATSNVGCVTAAGDVVGKKGTLQEPNRRNIDPSQ
ncbi:hypothetical protein BJ741DRAFT_631655 [Chytriomyces cf. hyalinus JEL632]|nr:hypothetical protein BJ741DRAFT_631655 [Chytriomyces cf. hyalinus JEL632]